MDMFVLLAPEFSKLKLSEADSSDARNLVNSKSRLECNFRESRRDLDMIALNARYMGFWSAKEPPTKTAATVGNRCGFRPSRKTFSSLRVVSQYTLKS